MEDFEKYKKVIEEFTTQFLKENLNITVCQDYKFSRGNDINFDVKLTLKDEVISITDFTVTLKD